MRREDVQLLIAALASTLGPGLDRQPRRSGVPLTAILAHGLAGTAATHAPGRLHAQARRSMLQALQLTLQCYDAWRDASRVIDAELRGIFEAAAAQAVKRAIEDTGLLCEPGEAIAALAPVCGDLDGFEPTALGAVLTDVIEGELLGGIGQADMPLSFRDFLRGVGSTAPGWHDAFTLYLAWEVKNDPEPLRTVLAAAVADAGGADPARLLDGLLGRAPGIAKRFDTYLKSTRETTRVDTRPYRLTERARFVDLIALQAWHLAARAAVPAPALVAALEPICRAVMEPVDVETELHHAAVRLSALWSRMQAAATTSLPVAEAVNAFAQGDLASAQQALSAAFAHAQSEAERAEVRWLEGNLQSLAGLWRHASRSFMEAADLLKGQSQDGSLGALIEVAHAFIREAELTGDARAAETAAKLTENIVAWAGRANPALRAEAGLAMALAVLVHRRASGRPGEVAPLVRLARRSIPFDVLAAAGASPHGVAVRIASVFARATTNAAGDEARERTLAADLVTALHAACSASLSPRDDAQIRACIAEIRAPADTRKGDADAHREAARVVADALTSVSRVEAPYLWSVLQGRLGQMLWRVAESQGDENGRAGRSSALIALERALQECGHDRGGADAARYLLAIAEMTAEQRDRPGSAAGGRTIQAMRAAEAVLPETTRPQERQRIALELAGALAVLGRTAVATTPTAARGLLEEAIAAFRRAAEIGDGRDHHRGAAHIFLKLGRTVSTLAGLERSRARYEEAIAAFERVVELTADGKPAGARTRAMQEMAELRQTVDTLRRAEERLRQAQ